MANTYVDIEDNYSLKSQEDDVYADVIIGNAQPGAYSIFLNTELIGQNKRVKAGKASGLVDKKLVFSVVVQDEREETNWTSAEITLEEGNSRTSYGPYSREVNAHLDTVTYTIKIKIDA